MRDSNEADGCSINFRIRDPLLDQLDNWRRAQLKIPNRAKAVRSLIQRALAASDAATSLDEAAS